MSSVYFSLCRPENTHLKNDEVHKTDLNLVYWSEEESNVSLSSANGSIEVYYIPKKDLDNPRGKELRNKFFRDSVFYFSEVSTILSFHLP